MLTNRQSLDETGSLRRWTSPALYGLHKVLVPLLRSHAHGRLLDVGCGSMPYQKLVIDQLTVYDGLDVDPRHANVRYVRSIMQMDEVPTGYYDIALCSEVLEHVDDPMAALREIHRVLSDGGTLLLSVPFLSRLHNEPDDYFRYTEYGLRHMLGVTGFAVREIYVTGSVFSFLGHQLSSLLLLPTWHLPILGQTIFALNIVLVVIPARLCDTILGLLGDRLPLGYAVMAEKSGRSDNAGGDS
jgi:SAM-dependent methyltransferase